MEKKPHKSSPVVYEVTPENLVRARAILGCLTCNNITPEKWRSEKSCKLINDAWVVKNGLKKGSCGDKPTT